jgi:hypothetical protein
MATRTFPSLALGLPYHQQGCQISVHAEISSVSRLLGCRCVALACREDNRSFICSGIRGRSGHVHANSRIEGMGIISALPMANTSASSEWESAYLPTSCMHFKVLRTRRERQANSMKPESSTTRMGRCPTVRVRTYWGACD